MRILDIFSMGIFLLLGIGLRGKSLQRGRSIYSCGKNPIQNGGKNTVVILINATKQF